MKSVKETGVKAKVDMEISAQREKDRNNVGEVHVIYTKYLCIYSHTFFSYLL